MSVEADDSVRKRRSTRFREFVLSDEALPPWRSLKVVPAQVAARRYKRHISPCHTVLHSPQQEVLHPNCNA